MPNTAVYAIGDLQGCLKPMRHLIKKSPIDLDQDQLWLVGDLVNRGPQSLETLRYVKKLSLRMGERLKVVLGNHDLHLLALAAGVNKTTQTQGMLEILTANDKIDLLEWLRHQPLMIRDPQCKAVLVHAGVYPHWSVKQASTYSTEVMQQMQSQQYQKLLKKMYGKRPTKWDNNLSGWPRYRFIINAMTRMRFCTRKGGLNFSYTGAPGTQPRNLYPWYQLSGVSRKNWRIIFGHWSSAGAWFDGNHVALDSGCVWGEQMTMARIDQRIIKLNQVEC